jgi:hypothetical protein
MRTKLFLLLTLLLGPLAAPAAGTEVVSIGGERVLIPSKEEVPEGTKAMWYVLGFGRTEDEATQDAIGKAKNVVADYLRRQDPPVSWVPSTSYIKDHLVPKDGAKRMEELDAKLQLAEERLINRKCYALPVRISQANYQAIVQLDRQHRLALVRLERQHRAEERMAVLGKVVTFLVAGFLLTIGYLRLEERTKGYLSRVLGLTVLAVLGILALGLFFCCQ